MDATPESSRLFQEKKALKAQKRKECKEAIKIDSEGSTEAGSDVLNKKNKILSSDKDFN